MKAFIVLLLGLCVGGLYLYLADPQRFPFRNIKITATLENLSAEEIQNIVEKHLHVSYFFCRTKAIAAALREEPWVDNVEITRTWPDSLKIIVSEKSPIVWWNEALLTARGEIIDPRQTATYDLPHLMGPMNQKREVLQIYQNVSKILSEYSLSIASLIWRNNQALDLVLTNGIQLNLGKQAIETRITRFCRAYSTVFAEKKAQLMRVDLRYPRGMAVQWSK